MPGRRHRRRAPAGPVVYGLRPESMHLGGEVPLRVEVIEPTGSETHVLGHIGATEVIGVFRERVRAQPGEEIRVRVDPEATHLFDVELGRPALGLRAGGCGAAVRSVKSNPANKEVTSP